MYGVGQREGQWGLEGVERVSSGIAQGLDLISRIESEAVTSIEERDYLRRAIVQVAAAGKASNEGGVGVTLLLNEVLQSLDAAVVAFDADESTEPYVAETRDALLAAKAAL